MEPCIGKWLIIGTCLLITLTGLWLAVLREMRNIKTGKKDIQKLLYDKQNGTFNFSLAIGVLLIGGGLYATIYTEQHNIGCTPETIGNNSEINEATILFKLDFDPSLEYLRFLERSPKFNDRNIARQESGYFEEEVNIPNNDHNYFALLAPRLTTNTLGTDVVQTPLEICFSRTEEAISENNILAIITAGEDKTFRKAASDPGCVILCDQPQTSNYKLPGFIQSAYAQEPNTNNALYGWAVPNLQTLKQEKKSGFSLINIRSKTLPAALQHANCFYYAVTINETSIYFDGLLPEHQLQAFDYNKGLDVEFGIENLGFSGNNDGFEKITISLEFFNNSEPILSIPLQLNYVALRKNDMEEVATENGAIFEWEAQFTANEENQVFVGSMNDAPGAVYTKKRLNNKNLTFNGSQLIGVIRPPYKTNTSYGVCVGLLLPNQQIKFTFNDQEAADIKAYLQGNNYSPLVRALRDN